MRFGLLGFLFAMFLLMHGCDELKDDAAFRRKMPLSTAQFLQKPFTRGWVHISDAHLDLLDAYISGWAGKHADPNNGPTITTEVFIPLLAHASRDHERTSALWLKTSEHTIVELLERAVKHPETLTDAERRELNHDHVRGIDGMLEPASDELGRNKVTDLTLPDGAAIIQNAVEPSPWYLGVIMLCGGLTMLGAIALQIARLVRR